MTSDEGRPKVSADEILDKYRGQQDSYSKLAERCRLLMEQLLASAGVRVHSISCRPKNQDSLREKLARPGKDYECLEDVTDLAGVRIIAYMKDDVDVIADIIESQFQIDEENSVDKREAEDPEKFGYASLHYVCCLDERRSRLDEYSAYRDLKFEIQVRSILQHAWAEIEHDLGYKSTHGVPREVRRQFSRLAALLETADEEFMRIRRDLAAYAERVGGEIDTEPQKVLLDTVSLSTYVSESAVVRRIDDAMMDSVGGAINEEVLSNEAFPSLLEVPLRRLMRARIGTVGELEAALNANEGLLVQYFSEGSDDPDEHPEFVRGVSVFHLGLLLLAKHRAKEALRDELGKFGSEEHVEKLIDAVVKIMARLPQ